MLFASPVSVRWRHGPGCLRTAGPTFAPMIPRLAELRQKGLALICVRTRKHIVIGVGSSDYCDRVSAQVTFQPHDGHVRVHLA